MTERTGEVEDSVREEGGMPGNVVERRVLPGSGKSLPPTMIVVRSASGAYAQDRESAEKIAAAIAANTTSHFFVREHT